MFDSAKKIVLRFAEAILDLDTTSPPVSQIKLLEDYLKKFEFDTNTKDVKEFLGVLKKKHLVDDIVVADLNGSSIASVNGKGVSTAVSGAALFNYVSSEIPGSEAILVKSSKNAWSIVFVFNGKLFIVKASSDVSSVELKALAREIEDYLSQKNGS